MLEDIVIVLHRPRNPVNIGGVVRAMRNMGLRNLRLVDPVEYDAYHITGIAHRSDEFLETVTHYPSLEEALFDVHYVVGTTARLRSDRLSNDELRTLAPDWLKRTAQGPVALVFGPEDKGLDNAALDRCHMVVRIPVDPEYASLNLAQAALILMYEVRMAALSMGDVERQVLEDTAAPPTTAQLEQFFYSLDLALNRIEFFKPGRAEGIMRSLRKLTYRAAPTQRETGLLTAIAREIVNAMNRASTKASSQSEESPTEEQQS
jgi:TrmH family RNA methyltransferase